MDDYHSLLTSIATSPLLFDHNMESAIDSLPQSSSSAGSPPDITKPLSQKKPRHRHTPAQLAALNELFEKSEHPALEQRISLAERLGMYDHVLRDSACVRLTPCCQGDQDG